MSRTHQNFIIMISKGVSFYTIFNFNNKTFNKYCLKRTNLDRLHTQSVGVIMLMLFILCCEKVPSSVESDGKTNNTIDQSSLGGKEGEIGSYFYDFNQDISAKFLYYSNRSKISNPSTMDPLTDTLNLRSFSEYLLTISREEFNYQIARVPFNEILTGEDINNDGILSPDFIPS